MNTIAAQHPDPSRLDHCSATLATRERPLHKTNHWLRTLTGGSLLVSALLTGCGDASSPLGPLEVANRFLDAFEAQDLPCLTELLSPDVVWEPKATFSGEPEDVTGSEAVASVLEGLLSRLESAAFSQRSLSENQGIVFAELVGDMRTRNGKPYRNWYLLKMHIHDGRITRVEEYQNPILFARAYDIDLCNPAPIQLPKPKGTTRPWQASPDAATEASSEALALLATPH